MTKQEQITQRGAAMSRKKLKRYKVRLWGTLPCSATIEVEAEDELKAREYAEERWGKADWDGADYDTPEGATVEVGTVEEQP